MSRKVVFKTYDQDQLSLLLPSYDDLVPSNYPVRIVNTIIEHLNIDAFVKYNCFHKKEKEAKSGKVKFPFAADKLFYKQDTNTYYCPMVQAMEHIGDYKKQATTGCYL